MTTDDQNNGRCPCGRRLHYTNAELEAEMRGFVARLGPNITVHLGNRAWLVPRHYIALHGLYARDLPELALKFNFTELETL